MVKLALRMPPGSECIKHSNGSYSWVPNERLRLLELQKQLPTMGKEDRRWAKNQLLNSIEAYEQSLTKNPNDAAAKECLDLARSILPKFRRSGYHPRSSALKNRVP